MTVELFLTKKNHCADINVFTLKVIDSNVSLRALSGSASDFRVHNSAAICPTEAVVDALILRARGDERAAIRALVVELAELRAATSLGYLRGVQPAKPERS